MRANARLPILLQTRAAVRFVSIEPLLGEMALHAAANLNELRSGLHWIIVGGESGPNSRPMHPDWARALRDEAVHAGIPFFFKQHGQFVERNPGGKRRRIGVMRDGRVVPVGTPGAVTLWNTGAKLAGDVLNGQVWHQYPAGFVANPPRRSAKRRRSRGDGRGQSPSI